MANTAGASGPNGQSGAKPTKVNRPNRQKLDRQIVQCLTRHSDDMINDLWEFSKENSKTMQRNITQLSRFTRDDILREIQAMPPQTTFFLESRGLNAVDFLGVFFKVLSRNPYTKSGKYSKNTDFVSNQKVIAQCYYDALAVLNISPAGSTFSTASAATTASQRTWKSVAPPAPAVSSENLAGGASRAVSRVSHISHFSQTSKPPASNLSHRSYSNKDVLSSMSLPPEYLSALSARPEEDELQDAGLPSSVSVRSSTSVKSVKSERPQSSFAAKHSQLQRLKESMKSLRARGGLASIANVGNPTSPGIGPDDSVSCVQQKNATHSTNNTIRSSASIASSRRKEAMSRPPRAGTLAGGSSYRPTTMSVFSTYTSNTLRAQRQQQQQQQQRFIDVPDLTTAAREEEEDSNGNSHYQKNGSKYTTYSTHTSNNGYEATLTLHSPVSEGDSQSQSSQSETESAASTESTNTDSDDFDGRPPSPKSVIQSHLHNGDEYSYTM
jgi:hypothetical protein